MRSGFGSAAGAGWQFSAFYCCLFSFFHSGSWSVCQIISSLLWIHKKICPRWPKKLWHSLSRFLSYPPTPSFSSYSVGVWYTKCFVIARAARMYNRRRRQQPSAKCPCFPKWFCWQCFGRATVESALSSQTAAFNNSSARQHAGGISITAPVLSR